MLSVVYIIICIFCLAISIAGVLLCHRWINTYNVGFHKNYLYYLIAFYTFAFYTIWGQIIVRTVLLSLGVKTGIIESVATTFPVLGVPFLFISWIMLINMVYSMTDMEMNARWYIIHFVMLAFVIAASWILYAFFIENAHATYEGLKYMEIGLLMVFEAIYFMIFVFLYFVFRQKIKTTALQQYKNFVALMVLGFLLRVVCLLFSSQGPWVLPMVVLLFFASNFIPVTYMFMHTDQMFNPVRVQGSGEVKVKLLVEKFQITKREQEVVLLICSGKTNQQIADDLFISLQTVKDHTHRIYTKIGIRSRMQLVQMVGG